MKFRTEVELAPSTFQINHHKKNLFVGSCFSNNIGSKLAQLKFPTLINPFGVVYNPISVKLCLEIIMSKDLFVESDLYYFNEQWFSLYHHSSFSSPDKNVCLKKINTAIEEAHQFLLDCDTLFLTFGTSWVYEKPETGNIVANCHKIPAKEFHRRSLNINEIVDQYKLFINLLLKFNPKLNIVFTLSPIRHWKDGPIENTKSKSLLNVAIHELVEYFNECSYFPSYEIIMDDLRDYRFYEKDLLHINDIGIEYIWSKFSDCFFNKETEEVSKQIIKILSACNHRPFNSENQKYKDFLDKQIKSIQHLSQKFDLIDFSKELEFLNSFTK